VIWRQQDIQFKNMADKLNSEFNYRYQVMGETVWEKIKVLKGFLVGRVRAAALEEVSELKYQAKLAELKMLKENNGHAHLILNLQADIIEWESSMQTQKEAFELNREEIKIIKKVLAECYEIAEPTRIYGYSDEQMFEANAANEFTVMIAKEIQAEIIAHGHPSPAKIRNAMSNPHTWNAIKQIGLIPKEISLLGHNNNPLCIELKQIES
jgi:hypothetical protein